MMKSPDQQLFDALYAASLGLGYRTHDVLPPEGAPYPFVHIGSVTITPRATKSYLLASATAQIDVYADIKDRRTASDMTHRLLQAASCITDIEGGLSFGFDADRSQIIAVQDTTTPTALWHFAAQIVYTVR